MGLNIELRGITAQNGLVYEADGGIGYDTIIEALDLLKLEEQGENLFLLVNSKNLKTVRKDSRFADRVTAGGDKVFFVGVVGIIAGVQVIISNRLNDNEAYILTPDCLTAFMKRDIAVETEREMSFKRTKIGADAHYVVAIEDYDKIVKIEL